ncbi:unnamed protein product [Heligmosomoides polygyrus]|uniref:Transmembrane protein n=1 Tax=Heligmosomoides polygyrus TaxID=6339 RepID=A0A3P7YJ07_HELPZ|nr:unnamed protein product [Heligmosomoides polygyrus]
MILFDKVPLPQYITNLWQWDVEWEELNPDYRCLLGRAHVVNAAKVLLWFDLIAVPLYVLFLFPWWIFFIGPHLVIIVLAVYALKKEKHRWMWPINLYAAFQFALWAVVTVLKLIVAIFNTDAFLQFYGQGHHEDFLTRAAVIAIVKAVVLLIGALLFWRLTVFHTVRKYFDAKSEGAAVPTDDEIGIEKLMRPI